MNERSGNAKHLPRSYGGVHWTGGCVAFDYDGDHIHGHMCAYLVSGSEKSLFVDTGHPAHAREVLDHLERFLEGRPLDYIFPTHSEMPHAGNLELLLRRWPESRVVGDMSDLHLYLPDHVERFEQKRVGDRLDLGDSEFVFLEAIWRDLPTSLWGFDTNSRALFVADGFAYTHYHHEGQCAMLASERPPPSHHQTVFINERALFWTRYTDVSKSFAAIDAVIERFDPLLIAPAHGGLIDDLHAFVPLLKAGMESMKTNRTNELVGY